MSVHPVPDSPLDRLAREARAEHQAAQRHWESAVEHAHRAGRCLLDAKALCRHGGWLPWLRDVGIPARTAQEYMRLARKYADPAYLPDTIADALEAVEDRERRERQTHLRTLSAKFDRIMDAPVRLPVYAPILRYADLRTAGPEWAWDRVRAHVREFMAAVQDGGVFPPPPPKSYAAKEIREALESLGQWLDLGEADD
jgi:hypothetical protein